MLLYNNVAELRRIRGAKDALARLIRALNYRREIPEYPGL
jgi:hypothetical protein